MHDIKPLEDKWLKYRAKKRKPWYLFLVFLSFFAILGFFFANKSVLDFKNIDINFKHSFDSEGYSVEKLLINNQLDRLELVDTPVISGVSSGSLVMKSESQDILVDIPILDNDVEVNTKFDAEIKKKNTSRKKVHLDIIETTSPSAYKEVEKRFYSLHNLDDALFLAKSYYKKENYKKSEEWALEANKLDDMQEESFLIFVKSKIKLGRKSEAVSILSQYLKYNNSKDAKILMYQLNNNGF